MHAGGFPVSLAGTVMTRAGHRKRREFGCLSMLEEMHQRLLHLDLREARKVPVESWNGLQIGDWSVPDYCKSSMGTCLKSLPEINLNFVG